MSDARGKLLGSGKVAEVFAFGNRVLKLYRNPGAKSAAFREAWILSAVRAAGLPVPVVDGVDLFDGRWGLVMERVSGPSVAEGLVARPETLAEGLAALARLHRQIHATPAPWLPPLKFRLRDHIGRADALDEDKRRSLIDALVALPDGDRLCHGDFYPFNVLGSLEAPVIVDWPDASSGDPAADLCRSFVLLDHFDPGIARAYVDAYLAGGIVTEAEVWTWLPFVAAARLAEGVAEEQGRLLGFIESKGLRQSG